MTITWMISNIKLHVKHPSSWFQLLCQINTSWLKLQQTHSPLLFYLQWPYDVLLAVTLWCVTCSDPVLLVVTLSYLQWPCFIWSDPVLLAVTLCYLQWPLVTCSDPVLLAVTLCYLQWPLCYLKWPCVTCSHPVLHAVTLCYLQWSYVICNEHVLLASVLLAVICSTMAVTTTAMKPMDLTTTRAR